jgi:hypothetical protein
VSRTFLLAQSTTVVENAAAEHGDEAVAVWWLFVAAFVIAGVVIAVRARRQPRS